LEQYERKRDRSKVLKAGRDKRKAFDFRDVPHVFVSVAAKGVRHRVSLLFATLAGKFISVAAKGVTLLLRGSLRSSLPRSA
jgi:hypothetical protein